MLNRALSAGVFLALVVAPASAREVRRVVVHRHVTLHRHAPAHHYTFVRGHYTRRGNYVRGHYR